MQWIRLHFDQDIFPEDDHEEYRLDPAAEVAAAKEGKVTPYLMHEARAYIDQIASMSDDDLAEYIKVELSPKED